MSVAGTPRVDEGLDQLLERHTLGLNWVHVLPRFLSGTPT
jgi:hypothetical protein